MNFDQSRNRIHELEDHIAECARLLHDVTDPSKPNQTELSVQRIQELKENNNKLLSFFKNHPDLTIFQDTLFNREIQSVPRRLTYK
jgi:hypothetical protein